MRLEGHDDAAIKRQSCVQDRGDLGRMMSVVVDDENAPRFTAHLESSFDASEFAQASCDAIEWHAELEAIGACVHAGHRQMLGRIQRWKARCEVRKETHAMLAGQSSEGRVDAVH